MKRYMGPLYIKVNPETCGWDTDNVETINENLSSIVNEIDIAFDLGAAGSF